MDEGKRLERYVRLRWGRKEGGIRKLADACETSPDTVYRWFRGVTAPDTGDLGRLARALGVKRFEIVAAMDGEASVVALDDETRRAIRAEVEAVLREQQAPPSAPRGRSSAA